MKRTTHTVAFPPPLKSGRNMKFQFVRVKENYRDEHESNSEWRMRREFLQSNSDAVAIERLICLSRCFISIEVYGCSYPSEVMAEVQQLSQNVDPKIMEAQRERMSQKYAFKFFYENVEIIQVSFSENR